MIRRSVNNVDYDSILGYPDEYNKTDFTIILKVFLTQMNPEPHHHLGHVRDGSTKYAYQRWTDAEWSTFRTEFKKDAEKHLNWPKMNLYLLPRARGTGKMTQIQLLYFKHKHPKKKYFEPYVRCGIEIEMLHHKDGSHVTFEVMRLRDGEPDYRSYDTQVAGGRDHGRLTHRDIDLWNNQGAVEQNTISHELGHVLGLDHSNAHDPQCLRKGINADVCYGKPGTPQYYDLMGHGNQINEADAPPWRKRIPMHARDLNWYVTTRPPYMIDI